MTPTIARLTDSALVLRRRCCFCAIPHALDGLGPILDTDLVSDGLCAEQSAKLNAEMDAEDARRVA